MKNIDTQISHDEVDAVHGFQMLQIRADSMGLLLTLKHEPKIVFDLRDKDNIPVLETRSLHMIKIMLLTLNKLAHGEICVKAGPWFITDEMELTRWTDEMVRKAEGAK